MMPRLQSAYRRHHSTESALVKVLSDIYAGVNEQQVTLLGLLDLSAAFDCNMSTISFSRNVGMGSSAHDFVGDAVINRRTSSSLHGRSVDSSTSAVELNTGSG